MILDCHTTPKPRRPVNSLALITGFVVLVLIGHGLFLFARYDSAWSLVFGVVSVLVCLVVAFLLSGRRIALRIKVMFGEHVAFVATLLTLGIMYMTVFSPGNVPDEMFHFNSTYKYSNMLLGQDYGDDFISMRGDDIVFQHEVMSAGLSRDAYDSTVSHFAPFVTDGEYKPYSVNSTYPISSNVPQQRVPAAIGISIAKLLHLGSVPLFFMGRLFNLLYTGSLIVAAVYIAPFGKNIIKTISLLPMTLHLLSSYSYDAASLGFAFLFTALMLKSICSEGPITRAEMISLAIVSFLLGPCKAIYVILLLGVCLIPSSRFSSRQKAILYKVTVVLLPIIGVAALRVPSLLESTGMTVVSTALDQRGEEFGTFYTLSDLLFQPIMAILLILRSFDHFGGQWIMEMVGGSLGWFQSEIAAPTYLVYAFVVLVLISSIRAYDDSGLISRRQKIVIVFLCALIILAAVVALAISWTFNWEQIIFGVQGRYFLPVLPLVCLSIRMPHLKFEREIGTGLLLAGLTLNLFYLARIFAIALSL